MTAKDTILNAIRQQVAAGKSDDERAKSVADRLEGGSNGIIPARGQISAQDRTGLFLKKAGEVQSTTDHVKAYDNVAQAISDYLRNRNLPQAIRSGTDAHLTQIDWSKAPQLDRATGPSDGTDLVGLSHAQSAVAETGTLILTSGAENPTTLNFLPEVHIVVVDAKDIEGDYESALDRVRTISTTGHMPRTVNMVTGPSRSGDIEQKILLGAHGPRSLHIIVVGT